MSDYYDDISQYIYGKPMCYEDLSDEELAKTRKTLKTIWEMKHVIVVIGQPKPRFDKIIPLLEYIETILQQRTECDVEDEIVENCSDNGEDNDDSETDTPPDIIPDIILPSLPNPDPLPPPLSQPPPLPSCAPVTTITTSPPDIIAPPPFPPSPNILSQLSQPRLHPPHHHHLPDIVAPPPLPLKPNIVSNPVHIYLDVRGRTPPKKKGARCVIGPFPMLRPLSILRLVLPFDIILSPLLHHTLKDHFIFLQIIVITPIWSWFLFFLLWFSF
jgi:hypothetical protein